MTESPALQAERLREQANEYRRKAAESFERSDTDGFLSQWAHGVNARRAEAEADLIENGGVADFPTLLDGDRRVDAKLVDGRYGRVWLLSDDEASRYGRRFIPFGENSRIQSGLGLHEGTETAPAVVKMTGGVSPYPYRERTDLYDWKSETGRGG